LHGDETNRVPLLHSCRSGLRAAGKKRPPGPPARPPPKTRSLPVVSPRQWIVRATEPPILSRFL